MKESSNNLLAFFFILGHQISCVERAVWLTLHVCLFAFVLPSPLAAQEIQLIDQVSQQPIPEVTITDENNNFLDLTDESGKADLTDWNKQTKLLFQHVAYENLVRNFDQIKDNNFTIELLSKNVALPEMTVKANRIQENYREVSNQLISISPTQIREQQAANSADLLQSSGNVFVQKSQMGGGSPIIRGLEANKVLIILDGVRLNNAIYRGGHLQSVITIDPAMLENVSVVFGPGSLVYGSDALGGVMAFSTKKPQVSKNDKLDFSGTVSTRFASVNLGKTGHLDVNLGGKKWAALSSISFNDFDDLRIGQSRQLNENDEEKNWGLRPFYSTQINGRDSILLNDKPHILKSTNYHQTDFLQKVLFQIGEQQELIFNFQYSTSSNIPRFDRLNDLTDSNNPASLKFAEWNYGPQERLLGAVHFTNNNATRLANEWQATVAFQAIEESRLKRRINNNWRDHQIEEVKVWSLNLDALKLFSQQHKLQYGFEWTQNDVRSTAFEQHIVEPPQSNPIETRYPNGENATSSYALYARHKWLLSNQLTLSAGLRWGLNQLEASFKENAPLAIGFNATKDQHQALTFALGAIYYPKTTTRLAANLSSGFRSPNIDDVGKLFDPSPNAVVVPNAEVGPEYSYSAELDYQQQIQDFSINVNVYGSLLTDLIRRNPHQLNGQDSIVYNGDLSQVFANTNTGKAQIVGIALGVDWKILNNLTFQNKVHCTKGLDISADAPLGHIPPVYGQSRLEWQTHQKNLENKLTLWTDFNLQKDIKNYSPNNEDKPDEALSTGTPAWFTLNARYHIGFIENGRATVAIENILDRHYKPFASGISGGGRNFLLGVSWEF